MKRLCLILAYLFLFTQTASAMPLLVGQKVVYRGTITGLRISAVDGTAFIDNLPLTYSSDFSAGVDGWTADGGTVAGNVDGIGGQDDVIRLTVGSTAARKFMGKSLLTVKKQYTITFKYYIPSGQSNVDSISLNATYWGGTTTTLSVVDTWTTVSKTFTASNVSPLIFAADGGKVDFTDAGGDDVFYIKDIKISEIQPFMDGNHSIEIYDSSNRMLKGVLKAAGTGETLSGTEKITGWTNHASHPYETFTASGKDITQAVNTTGIGIAQAPSNNGMAWEAGLYKYTCTLTINSGEAPYVYAQRPSGTNVYTSSVLSAGETSLYFTISTAGTGNFDIRNQSTLGDWANTQSLKQVLTPSSSGATIVSAKGGEVYNFSYKNDSFKYNAASYYVIIRAIR